MLSAAVNVYKSLGNDYPSKQLYGYDIDATAFMHLARMGIDNSAGNFKKQDFLRSAADGLRVDAVLANPPFVSYHRLNESQRKLTEQLKKRYLPHLPWRASLWAFFLLHSLTFLRAGGRMAYVLPNAVGFADYAQPLLTFLRQRFSQVELVHVNERLFIQAGADERISLLFLSGYAPDGVSTPAPLRTRDIENVAEILETDDSVVQLAEYPKIRDVREQAVAALSDLCANALCSLGSVASIRIGEVVGNVRFFVQPLSVWLQLQVDNEYLMPLLTRSSQVRGLYVPRGGDREGVSIPYLLLPPERRLSKAVKTYLAQYPEAAIESNKTFGKRPVWYRCSYDTGSDAFIGSMTHDYPRIIGNDSGISCSNAFYKITLQKRRNLVAWLPILSLTTPLRLSAEILGRVRGSGGIKLEPSDVKKLCIPAKVPTLAAAELNVIRKRMDRMLRQGELDAAGQLADSLLFLQTGLIDVKAMSKLRLMRLSLTSYRLTAPKRDG